MSDTERDGTQDADTAGDSAAGTPAGTPADTPADIAGGADTGRPARRRANPGAAAASRARRIGGAAAAGRGPRPRPDAELEAATAGGAGGASDTGPAADADAARTVVLDKPDSAQTRLGEPAVVTQVPNWLRWLPAGVLGAAAVVLAVLVVVSAKGYWYSAPDANQIRSEVLSAAKSCVVATNSYSYKTFDRDEKAGVVCTTGDYTDNYRQAMERLLKPNATNLKSVQTAQINDAGVEAVTPGGTQWSVVVYGQITVSNVNTTQPRVDPFSAVVLMQKAHGAWKIVKIDPVSLPSS